ncbi:MAG: lasso peptide biosynthesis B2 protein, partial [Acidobacteria bacterium]|nr:lasso peptide biosynthesis B2 protein [Acidobacteriota bacterium]
MANPLSAAAKGARFARRHPREAWLVARMATGVAAVSAAARVLPLPRALSLVAPGARASVRTADGLSDERVAQLLDALLGLNLLFFTPTCWKRAAVLHRQLALRGRETRVVFGVRREGDDVLAGHAWVEAGGEALFEKLPPEYAVTYCFPS